MKKGIKNLKVVNPSQLLKQLNIEGIPDVVKMVKSCGFEVIGLEPHQTISASQERSASNMLGAIKVEKHLFSVKKQIMFSQSHAPITRRFVVAYLFAGYQLNCNREDEYREILFDESIYDRKTYNYTIDLLIPDVIFSNDYEQIKDISKLANRYNVSEYLVREKIKRKERKQKFELI